MAAIRSYPVRVAVRLRGFMIARHVKITSRAVTGTPSDQRAAGMR